MKALPGMIFLFYVIVYGFVFLFFSCDTMNEHKNKYLIFPKVSLNV